MNKLSIPYVGSKNKLQEYILPIIHKKNFDLLASPFCGSCSIEMNVNMNYSNIFINDKNSHLIQFYKNIKEYFKDKEFEKAFLNIINLSKSLDRLKSKEEFIQIRTLYNKEYKNSKPEWHIYHFLYIISHSFCNIIRFNKKNEINATYGNRHLNDSFIQKFKNLALFLKDVNSISIMEFDAFISSMIKYGKEKNKKILFYIDPPYLDTDAPYNSLWKKEHEYLLYRSLLNINNSGNYFVLSNIWTHNSKENSSIQDFVDTHNFQEILLEFDYSNSFNKKDKSKSIECIIKNY